VFVIERYQLTELPEDMVPLIQDRMIKGEGTPSKLATATQPQFPTVVISLS
jgi:hypothetical protein